MSDSFSPRPVSTWIAALFMGAVCAPLLFAQNAHEDAKFNALDGAKNDTFGRACAISGSFAVVGAPLDVHNGVASGSAYVFQNQGGSWVQVAKLVPSDAAAGDVFGGAVAIDADRVVVGADSDDDKGPSSGSAYVFRRNSNGTWSQEAKLTASDGFNNDYFGSGVAISGDRVAVGAVGDDDGADGAGSVYIYERVSTSWQQKTKFTTNDPSYADNMGRALALDGDRLVLGSYRDDDLAIDGGAAYVFERQSNGTWQQRAKLQPSTSANFDYAGYGVALSGDRAVLGVYGSDEGGNDRGHVLVFERQWNGTWQQKAKLFSNDGGSGDRLGYSVGISGSWMVAGAYGNQHMGSESGAAYLFERQANGAWSQVGKLTASDASASDQYGRFLALDGHCAVIGSYLDDDNGSNSGSAYIVDIGPLLHSKNSVSIAANGSQTLLLRAGKDWANSGYLFLGSMSGTSGVSLGAGVVLPLTPDPYTQFCLGGGLPIIGGVGVLDGNGNATATFRVPAGTSSAFAGTTLHHAFIAVNPASGAYMASNAARVTLTF